MLSLRLVHLIEAHSADLSRSLLEKISRASECTDLSKVPLEDLRARTSEVYRNLSDWLVNKSEGEIATRYISIGMQRAEQGVRFSHFVWGFRETKENLREFVEREGISETPIDLYASIELLTALDRFFDSAVYHAAIGYERYLSAQARGGAASASETPRRPISR